MAKKKTEDKSWPWTKKPAPPKPPPPPPPPPKPTVDSLKKELDALKARVVKLETVASYSDEWTEAVAAAPTTEVGG